MCPSPTSAIPNADIQRIYRMKGKAKKKVLAEQEPMGIVISRGPNREQPPRFSAYMWAPDPEMTDEESEPKVA